MTTINGVRDRVMALCELCLLPPDFSAPHAYKTEEECSFSSDVLPAFIVEDASGNQDKRSVDIFRHLREFRLILYTDPICDESYQKDMVKGDRVRDCIDAVRLFFAQRPTLSLDNDSIVESLTLGRDIGDKTLMTKKNKYHGTVFRLSVVWSVGFEQID